MTVRTVNAKAALVLAGVCLAGGWNARVTKGQAGAPPTATAAPAPAPVATAPIGADVLAMVREIESDMNRGTGEAFDRHFDKSEFTEAVFKYAPPGMNAEGFRQGVKDNLKLGAGFKQGLGNGGTYRLLRVRTVNGQPRAVFRFLGATGLNYHEMVIGRDAFRRPTVTDVYIFMAGELLSQTMGRQFQFVNPGGAGVPTDMVGVADQVRELRTLAQAGKGAEALAVFDRLPEPIKGEKAYQLLRLAAAGRVDVPTYQKVLEEYTRRFPGDATSDLMSIDRLFVAKDFDGLDATLQRLDKSVGGDPYLSFMRANGQAMKGNVAGAKKLAAEAIAQEPTLQPPYDLLLGISIDEKDYDQTVEVLGMMERNLGMRFNDLTKVQGFEGFVASEQYRKWKAGR